MKQIIDGKMYNTETAESLAFYDNGLGPRDFNYYSEELYIKRTGEYFLHGEGHGLSKYATIYSNGSSGWGEHIIPLTYEEARNWAEKNIDVEEYETIFGEVSENGEEATITFTLPQSLYERIKRETSSKECSMKALLIKAVESYLK